MDSSTSHGRATVCVVFTIRYRKVSVAVGRTQRRAQTQRTRGAISKRSRGMHIDIITFLIF